MASTTTPGIPPVTLDTITQQIGNTPLVRLNRLPRSLGIDATVYAKLEYFNAGGSVKDRIALRMIEEAERSGRIKPGDTLIEPTSGNTYVPPRRLPAVCWRSTNMTLQWYWSGTGWRCQGYVNDQNSLFRQFRLISWA